MFNKEIPIDIMSSTEINFVENIQKRPRRSKEDYDAEDSFVDNLEGEDEMVYIECTMDDFFVYSGTLPTTAKRVAKKYKKREERKSKDKEDKDTKEEKKEKDDINNKTVSIEKQDDINNKTVAIEKQEKKDDINNTTDI